MPARHRLIVESDHCHIVRDSEFELAGRLQGAERHGVIDAEQGVGRISRRKQVRSGAAPAFVCGFVVGFRVQGKSEPAEFIAVALAAIAVG